MSDSDLVVVTGADGFIGHALVAHFDAAGRPYRALVRNVDPARKARFAVRAVGDLAGLSDVELDTQLAGARAIVHLAGRAHVVDETDPEPAAVYVSANVAMTERLAAAAVRKGVRRFVFASTVKVNGEASVAGRPFRPDDPAKPRDHYARSKRDAEHKIAAICKGTTMKPIILRLPLVYGPGVKGNFLALLDEVARARPLPLGAVHNHRSLLYVGNLAAAIDAALDVPAPPAGVHFVTDAESVSVPALITGVAKALGVAVRLKPVPVRLLRFAGRVSGRRALIERLVGTLEGDPASFINATDWWPPYTLAEGLAETARWWKLRHSI
jgi:nucleoside-diphosphate-sugar epimerase